MSTVLTSVEGGIGRVTLNRPAQMNAVTVALGAELEAATATLAAVSPCRSS